MTTTNPNKITPEEWRTAAKVARRSIFGNSELADAWENVAKYSAAADLTTELAKAYRAAENAVAPIQCEWDQLPEDYQELGRVGIRGVLEFLTSADRLLADDEMRLTAEQVEDVRIVTTEEVGGYTGKQFRRWHAAKDRLVESLFSATAPTAVRDGSDLVVVQRSHTAKAVQSWMTLDLWTDLGKNDKDFDAEYERQGFGDLWATLLGEVRALVQATTPAPAEPAAVEVDPRAESQAACLYAKLLTAGEDPGLIFQAVLWAYERVKSNPEIIWLEDLYQAWESRASAEATVNSTLKVPAPAEPAEEETKAEQCAVRLCVLPARHSGVHTDREGLRWNNPTSSPVVSAPTETEWQTWQEVPDEVVVIRDRDGDRWKRSDAGSGWKYFSRKTSEWADVGRPNSMYAPFVAAEEG